MNKNPSLTKTCVGCGLEKPLSAFLQVAGPEGTMYGSLCAACRSGKIEKAPAPKEKEESTTSSTGFKIDSKSKAKTDKDKRLFRKEIEDKYREEREKLKEGQLQKTEKTEKKQKLEKQHRESFLKTRSFISEKAETKKSESAPAQKTAGYQDAASAKEEKTRSDQATKEEYQAKNIDTLGELPTRFGLTVKATGASFRAWLAANPHMAAAKAFGVDKQNQAKGAEAQKTAEKNDKKAAPAKADIETAKEYIKENFGPSSRRGR